MKTKTCSKCGRNKSTKKFYRNSASSDGLQGWCKKCISAHQKKPAVRKRFNKYQRQRYYEMPRYAERMMKLNRDREARRREVINKYKRKKGCAICGTHKGRLVFHHRDPDSTQHAVSQMLCLSIKRIKAEIKLCVVLCNSCHVLIHNAIRRKKLRKKKKR